eukprot:6179364-Pleurochrysis_carterae.AAC.2
MPVNTEIVQFRALHRLLRVLARACVHTRARARFCVCAHARVGACAHMLVWKAFVPTCLGIFRLRIVSSTAN